MLPYLSAVTPQIAFTHSVREFIRELLKRFIPGKWIDRVISDGDATFDAKLDEALVGLDEKTATEKDYCAAKTPTRRSKNGIIRDVKSHAKSAFALTLSIAGGLASPLRSEAALDPTTAQNGVAFNEARAEVRGCVVRVTGVRRGSSSNGADCITSTVLQGLPPRAAVYREGKLEYSINSAVACGLLFIRYVCLTAGRGMW